MELLTSCPAVDS